MLDTGRMPAATSRRCNHAGEGLTVTPRIVRPSKRRQRAEQAAQKAAFKLLLPLGALLFPTMFIVILGPALLNISDMLSGGAGNAITLK